MYDIERVYRATGVQDAIRALQEDENAVAICGGSDVLIKIREGRLAGCSLVSIHGLPELQGVKRAENGDVVIGPCTSFTHVANDPVIRECIPLLAHAVEQVGGPQVRNTGTIGGNVCNGATSADSAPSLFTLEAVLELTGPRGKRTVPIREFYRGPGRVDLTRGELLTAVTIPKESWEGCAGHYIKYAQRRAMDIATLGCAVHVKLSREKDRIDWLRIAYGVAGPTPMRCVGAEECARGQRPTEAVLQEMARTAAGEINPRTSWRASREFRLQLAEELAVRAAKQAIELGGGAVDA